MTPALLVECGFKALRHPRIVVARIATWAGSAGGSAGACVFAFPGSIRVSFTNPAAILAEGAFHGMAGFIRTFATNHAGRLPTVAGCALPTLKPNLMGSAD